MATTNRRGQCAVEAALVLAVFAAILISLYSLSNVSRTIFSGATLSKEIR